MWIIKLKVVEQSWNLGLSAGKMPKTKFLLLAQIASMFSVKYFCNQNFQPESFLDCQNGCKNSENNEPRHLNITN